MFRELSFAELAKVAGGYNDGTEYGRDDDYSSRSGSGWLEAMADMAAASGGTWVNAEYAQELQAAHDGWLAENTTPDASASPIFIADGPTAGQYGTTGGSNYESYDPLTSQVYHLQLGSDNMAHEVVDAYNASPTMGTAFANTINMNASLVGLDNALANAFGPANVGQAVDMSNAGGFITVGGSDIPLLGVGVYVATSGDFGVFGSLGFSTSPVSVNGGIASDLNGYLTGPSGSSNLLTYGNGFNDSSGAFQVGTPQAGLTYGISIPDAYQSFVQWESSALAGLNENFMQMGRNADTYGQTQQQ